MLRSLFTGISGLRAHQQMLDVTSSNIANVNTVGYKSSSAVFEDTLSQTVAGAGAPSGTTGGTNPIQVGLGVQLAGTSTNFSQGSNQYTGRTSDLLINGDGFFVLNHNGQQTYSRAGSFSLDSAGELVSPDGSIVQSAAGGNLNLSALNSGTYVAWSISPLGGVNGVDHTGTTTAPGSGGRGTLTAGYLEMSNVDLASELTNLIISERGFQANSRVITTSDEVL